MAAPATDPTGLTWVDLKSIGDFMAALNGAAKALVSDWKLESILTDRSCMPLRSSSALRSRPPPENTSLRPVDIPMVLTIRGISLETKSKSVARA